MVPQGFQLWRGDILLGDLRVVEIDMPWWIGRFAATPEFEAIRPLFVEEDRLLNENIDAWEEAYARVDALGLRIVPIDGSPALQEWLLHIRDDEAWLRY